MSEINELKINVEDATSDVVAPTVATTAVPEVPQAQKDTMPQLEMGTFASQIFWLVITFGVLYLIMARSCIPNIRDVLQNRQTRISEDLSKAEKLKEEAESAEADFTSVIVNARSKASTMLAKVRDEAAEESDRRNAKLDETFARQAKESEHRIEVIKKEAVTEMTPVAVEVTQEILKKLINVKVDKAKVEKKILAANASK